MDYVPLDPAVGLPATARRAPFKAVLIADQAVDFDRQYAVCNWLQSSGCVYVMVTGLHCDGWKRMFDLTNLARFEFAAIPDKQVVIATEHPDDSLSDVFWFSRYSAMHPLHAINDLSCVHITNNPRAEEIISLYSQSG